MRRVYEGSIDGRGRRVAIAASRFNRLVTDPLVAGAVEELRRHGVAADDVDLAWVPGAFELPLVAEGLAAATRATGVPIAFGVLTCDTMEQALDRAGGKAGNKGGEAAVTALEMCGLLEAIDKQD